MLIEEYSLLGRLVMTLHVLEVFTVTTTIVQVLVALTLLTGLTLVILTSFGVIAAGF